ncbi:hypothetical protein HYT56_00490 [Candidatus Woesearchaeota archaeon]|nr:hypothetical protein [Candidatus Woesearchaeota archaeon]
MKNSTKIITAVIILVLAIFFFTRNNEVEAGKYDEFAKCITEKGAIFYGSFQCIHCGTQKEMFGNSMQYINYVECGPLGGPQNLACQQAKINSYPTWDINGARYSGVQQFDRLAELTGCQLLQ